MNNSKLTENMEVENPNKKYVLEFIKNSSSGNEYSNEELFNFLKNSGIDYTSKIFVGLCFGLMIEEKEFIKIPYEQYELYKIDIYRNIQEIFESLRIGFLVKKDDSSCNLIAVIPKEEKEHLIDKYLAGITEHIKSETGFDLHVGVGVPTDVASKLKASYDSSKFAYNFYFFEPQKISQYHGIEECNRLSFDVYEVLIEEVYKSIVAKEDTVCEKIEEILKVIGNIHYGDRYRAINRCIMFVGELGKKLKDLNPAAADWRSEQEEMQEQLRYQTTYESVCEAILNFYRNLIPRIYKNVEKKNMYEIIEIKNYIQENYMKDISLKDIADIMCVSHSYFSTFFKNATGKNFKTFLTEVRMQEALNLVLRTNMKTYEISEAVGYNNVRRFVDAFKSIYKLSPLEYRKLHGNISK